MKKIKPRDGYRLENCPICESMTYEYCSYSEFGWGIVEQHGFCRRCGYVLEQAYSDAYDCFLDITKGFKKRDGVYVPKDVRKHKRIRRKLKIKGIKINPEWVFYT